MTRRHFLQTSAAAVAGAPVARIAWARSNRTSNGLGLTIASYAQRWRAEGAAGGLTPFENALDVLYHAADLGAGCLQIGVGDWTKGFAGQVRDVRERLGIALEGQIRLPAAAGDVAAFEQDALAAREAGAHVLRAVCLSGRRYETFDTLDAWRAFLEQSWTSLTLAEPVVRKLDLILAVENHKDWRIGEMIGLMERLDSEAVGVCLDTGNNVALLEDPLEAAAALAPWTRTVHFKDMALEGYDDGFLLAEVPLGEGYLDLKRIVDLCRAAYPDVWFNLEMITRDPLPIPVLTDAYWTTLRDVPAYDLAATLADVRRHGRPLPRISGRSPADQLAAEEQHVRASFAYAREHLAL